MKSKWKMIFDTEHMCGGIDFDTFEAAKNDAIETYILWQNDFMGNIPPVSWTESLEPMFTEEEKEDWNYMIANCFCHVDKLNEDTGEYETYWYPSDEELEEIGWREY